MAEHTCNPRAAEKGRRIRHQWKSQLQNRFQATLGYRRICHINKMQGRSEEKKEGRKGKKEKKGRSPYFYKKCAWGNP